jgi:hypothetical protein
MSTVELKANLHLLIDGIQNSKLLESLHDILTERKNSKEGQLWNALTESQRKEVLESFQESEDPNNLTPHSEILREFFGLKSQYLDSKKSTLTFQLNLIIKHQ